MTLAKRPSTLRDELGRKYCSGCRRWRDESEFSIQRGSHDGLNYRCRKCNKAKARAYDKRDSRLKYKYNLTSEQFEAKLVSQDYACEICRRYIDATTAQVDHDHSCCPGKRSCGMCVRGLLCGGCNGGLGLLGENVATMRRAIKYVECHKRSRTKS